MPPPDLSSTVKGCFGSSHVPLSHLFQLGGVQVAQTCQLAMQRIEFFSTNAPQVADDNFRTIDPAPAAPSSTPTKELRYHLQPAWAAMTSTAPPLMNA